jgi:hypothetical protein
MTDRRPRRHTTEYDLLDAFAAPGCPICRLTQRAVRRYLEALAAEGVTDVEARAQLRAAHAFCARHARQWADRASGVLGTAIIYQDVLQSLAADLERSLGEPGGGSGLFDALGLGGRPGVATRVARALAPRGRCPACRHAEEAEARLLGSLLDHLGDAEFGAAFAASAGLCLPHFRQAAARGARTGRAESVRRLAERQLRLLRQLGAELGEVIRKHDDRFRHEPWGAERDAPARAIRLVVGEEGAGPASRSHPRAASDDGEGRA